MTLKKSSMKKSCRGLVEPSQDCVKNSLNTEVWKVYLNGLQIGYHYDRHSAEEQAALYLEKGYKMDKDSITYPNGITVHSIYLNDKDEQQ